MRIARQEREKKALDLGLKAGAVFKWVPGSAFPSVKGWEDDNSDVIEVGLEKAKQGKEISLRRWNSSLFVICAARKANQRVV